MSETRNLKPPVNRIAVRFNLSFEFSRGLLSPLISLFGSVWSTLKELFI